MVPDETLSVFSSSRDLRDLDLYPNDADDGNVRWITDDPALDF